LGGRAYSALPCAGAPPPQRPLSYNMPRRPGVDIGDRCLIEGVQPDHVPPVPSIPSIGLPSPPPQLTDPTVRPSLAPALRLAQRRLTTPATAGTDSPPDCSHPRSGMHLFPHYANPTLQQSNLCAFLVPVLPAYSPNFSAPQYSQDPSQCSYSSINSTRLPSGS